MLLFPHPLRLLLASVVRSAAFAVDDAASTGIEAVFRRVDRLASIAAQYRRAACDRLATGAMHVLDRSLAFSGRVAGCDCTDDSAEGCTRDGEDRACGCGCHPVIEAVLP